MHNSLKIEFDKETMGMNLVRILSQFDKYSKSTKNREHPLFYKTMQHFREYKDNNILDEIKNNAKTGKTTQIVNLVDEFLNDCNFDNYYNSIKNIRNNIEKQVQKNVLSFSGIDKEDITSLNENGCGEIIDNLLRDNFFNTIEDAWQEKMGYNLIIHPSPLITAQDKIPVYTKTMHNPIEMFLPPSHLGKIASYDDKAVRYTVAKELSKMYAGIIYDGAIFEGEVLNDDFNLVEKAVYSYLKDKLVIDKLRGEDALKESLVRAVMLREISPSLDLIKEDNIDDVLLYEEKENGYRPSQFFDKHIQYAKHNGNSLSCAIFPAVKNIIYDYTNHPEKYEIKEKPKKVKIPSIEIRNIDDLKYL